MVRVFLPVVSRRLMIGFLAVAAFVSACGREKTTVKKAVPSQRNGESVPSAEVKWQDISPRLSADGNKLVFVSGRSGAYRIWKWERSIENQTTATRLTKDDTYIAESLAELSPDGSWVLSQVSRNAQTDLILAPFSGESSVVISDDSLVETDFVFSPDSALFAFIRRTSPRTGGQVVLGRIGDGTAPTLVALGETTDKVVDLSWIPATTGYTLAHATRSESALTWIRRSFTSLDDAPSVEPSTLVESLAQHSGVSVADGAQDKFLTVQSIRPAGRVIGQEIGNEADPARQYIIRSQAVVISSDGSQSTSSPASILDVRVGALDATGAQAMLLGKEMLRCTQADPPASRGIMMQVATDGTNPVRWVPKRTGEIWSVVSDPCDVSGESVALDFQLIDLHWNKNATSPVVAFVTNFSGDPEVKIISKDGASGVMTLTDISANARPAN
jgi:hypothetical protein